MQKLLSLCRAAVDKYSMIAPGDRIAVGLSGGKDSVLLLKALAELRRFYPSEFTLSAITLDPCFGGKEADYSELSALCEELSVEYIIRRTDIADVVFNIRKEPNPCSLCARLRRGMLHDTIKENGINKLALGHHMDDAVETFYMNLLLGGNISCFKPVTHMTRKDIYVIRPLVFTPEREIIRVVNNLELPVVKSKCPVDKTTERMRIRNLIDELDAKYPGVTIKTVGAIQRAGIDGW